MRDHTRQRRRLVGAALCLAAMVAGCADRTPGRVVGSDPPALAVGMSWQWQLQGEVDTSLDVAVYDVDLFDAPDRVLEELLAGGRIVLCYLSAGSFEEWRADADAYPEAVVGEPLDGWPGEGWVDVRSEAVRSVLLARLDPAAERGCDGVEPDNVDGYLHDTGFELTAADQLSFNRWLADAAHERGLLVGLKNDLDQIPALVEHYDFAVNEQCVEYDECDAYAPFIAAGKPVFVAEYAAEIVENPTQACAIADALGLSLIVVPLDLDGSSRNAC